MATPTKIHLPQPWTSIVENRPGQYELVYWDHIWPKAQCLVAPCGTKVGKTFGCSLWMSKECLMTPGLFCVYVAPTYAKCKIAYRYIKKMVGAPEIANCVDGLLEIRFRNGTILKFLHGRDAEVTIEGEGVDRFVIDEAGKIGEQVWYSTLTTITQTGGYGIVTGTPRGFTWYYDIYTKAVSGDPFFASVKISTESNPFNNSKYIAEMKRLLPAHLYMQYYEAEFNRSVSVFGDISGIWDYSLVVPRGIVKFWIHPDLNSRSKEVIHGVDIAKQKDWTVFYSVNLEGQMVGFCRFQHSPYTSQVAFLVHYIKSYFGNSDANSIYYDETGVGIAFGDLLVEANIDAAIEGVTFTNASKNAMVMRLTLAIEQGWLRMPYIEQVSHELLSYEMTSTKTGLPSFNGGDGVHDDVVSAMMLAVANAYDTNVATQTEKLMEKIMCDGEHLNDEPDDIIAYSNLPSATEFFSSDTMNEDELINFTEE